MNVKFEPTLIEIKDTYRRAIQKTPVFADVFGQSKFDNYDIKKNNPLAMTRLSARISFRRFPLLCPQHSCCFKALPFPEGKIPKIIIPDSLTRTKLARNAQNLWALPGMPQYPGSEWSLHQVKQSLANGCQADVNQLF